MNDTVIDLSNEDAITIDGLIALHEEHGDSLTVILTPAHRDYIYGQVKGAVGPRLATVGENGRTRTITLRYTDWQQA